MKVLHVLNSYLPNHIAGTEVYVSRLVKGLQLKNIETVIIIPNVKNTTEEYTYENIRVIKYAEPSIANREIISGKQSPRGLVNFLHIVKFESPDLIHFHELAGSRGIGMFHLRAVKELGYKSIITFHLVKYSCPTGTLMYLNESKCDGVIRNIKCSNCFIKSKEVSYFRRFLLKLGFTFFYFLRIDTRFLNSSIGTAFAMPFLIHQVKFALLEVQDCVDKIIVLTKWYRDILVANGLSQSKISIIEQGVSSLQFSNRNIHKEYSYLHIVFIGRICEIKGVDLLVMAVKDLPVNKIRLDIYGSYTDIQYFKKILQLINGTINIKWKGEIDPNLVIQTLSRYDILCIPSRIAEVGPLVLKEAFAAGIPVIASNVYGNLEQIEHNKNGWLFNFNDKESLKSYLLKLIENRSLITEAKEHIRPVKDFNTVVNEHINLYKGYID